MLKKFNQLVEDHIVKVYVLAGVILFGFTVPKIVAAGEEKTKESREKQAQREFNIRSETWEYQTRVGDNYLEKNLNGELRWITQPVEK